MWKSLVEGLGKECRFEPQAKNSEIAEAEAKLNIALPDALKACLLESNGVFGEYDLGLVWPVERIISTNIEFRENTEFSELYMPFDSMLFFADAGNGDQFFFPLQGSKVRRNDVFVWNHEDDSRNWVAPSMQKYIEWWVGGKINV
jgi:hypothetical protein